MINSHERDDDDDTDDHDDDYSSDCSDGDGRAEIKCTHCSAFFFQQRRD